MRKSRLTSNKKDYASAEIVVGMQDVGKTTFVEENIVEPAFSRNVPIYIFDVQNEWGEYNNEEARNITDFQQFLEMVKDKENSIIIFEEATVFFKHNSSDKIITKMLVDIFHSGNIIVLNFHSFRKVPKYIIDMVQVIHICKTKDTVSVIEKLDDNPEFIEAFTEVQKHPDKYYKQSFYPLG